jgi:hypothetical protein
MGIFYMTKLARNGSSSRSAALVADPPHAS